MNQKVYMVYVRNWRTSLGQRHSRTHAARLVSGAGRWDHITPVLRSLHWLPVQRMIILKTAVLVWKCIPVYLQEVRIPVEKCPRSSSFCHLQSASPRVWSCRECWRQPASGASASTVPQCGIVCSARRQSLTEHVHVAAEDLSVWWTVTAHQPAPLLRFVILASSINVITYLLTYTVQLYYFVNGAR